jgi:hypothetical protein
MRFGSVKVKRGLSALLSPSAVLPQYEADSVEFLRRRSLVLGSDKTEAALAAYGISDRALLAAIS